MDVQKEHERLYRRLPKMQCKEGCNECCGPVPFSKWETANAGVEPSNHQRVSDILNTSSLNCNCIDKGKCKIYDKRPFMCRLFGTTERLKCPYGFKPEWEITEELAQELTAKYRKLMEKNYE